MSVILSPTVALAVSEAHELVGARADLNGRVCVLGDDALALAVRDRFDLTSVRAHHDLTPLSAPAPEGVERMPLGPELFADVVLVVAELPKANAELDQWAQLAAAHGAADVVVVAAGRDKHMSRGLNDQLAHSFATVSASRGVRKARALRATTPLARSATPPYPRTATIEGLPFAVTAHGGAFAGARLDIGTRALLDVLDAALPAQVHTALDLGCGTGVLATSVALRLPEANVIASDISAAAIASTRATADGAGVGARVRTMQQDAAAGLADASVDLVVFNPPFHTGHAVIEDMAHRLFDDAARVLRPGGVLLCVFNSHLPHRAALERAVGPTAQLSRTTKFTVTRSVKR